MARSRRRRGEPVHSAKPFYDGRDSHRSLLHGWGGPHFWPNALETALPPARSNVHRLLSRIRDAALLSGYGADKPHVVPRFTPVAAAPIKLARLPAARRQITPLQASFRAFNVLRFPNPKVAVCVRRKVRKEVLHALGVAGSRGLGRSGVHRSADSSWGC